MASANILVGKQGLSIDGFENYIEPELVRRGYMIADRISVNGSEIGKEGDIFISLIGDLAPPLKKLEESLTEAEINAGNDTQKYSSIKEIPPVNATWPHQVMFYKIVGGPYSEDTAASRIFPALAAEYICRRSQLVLDLLERRIQDLGNRRFFDFAPPAKSIPK
jgi:hypothetical protein